MTKKSIQEKRSDAVAAREAIMSVFAGRDGLAIDSFLKFLAASIDFLSASFPDRWGITLFDWGVRLNVGWVECLVLHRDGLRILVEKEVAPPDARLDGAKYVRAPGCDMTTLSLAEIPFRLDSLVESHMAALLLAARSPIMRSIKLAHSTGVVAFLSETMNRRIANPSFVDLDNVSELIKGDTSHTYIEGDPLTIMARRYERDAQAREKCISHHGLNCAVCGMSFRERYGEPMADFIHVHHLVPLATIGIRYVLNPYTDLRPVCPNCHAVIHGQDPPLSIEQARSLILR